MRIKILRVIEVLGHIERNMAQAELREADWRKVDLAVAAYRLEYANGTTLGPYWRRLNRQRWACQRLLNEYLSGMEFERGYR